MRFRTILPAMLRVGLSLALLSAAAWLLVLLLPPLSDSEFSALEAYRNEEVARREASEFELWTHQPIIIAARQIGPFVNPAVSLLSLLTFPAVLIAERQVAPPLCFGLPLLKQESWRAFYLTVAYSALMWLALGMSGTGAVLVVRHVLRRRLQSSPG